ncbi:MAG TPA: hypothetical protein VJ932_05795, partial [Alkalispirochaeta sp.]|nr:hypothetical protein [Alkalispirochaeta sp.]
IFHYHLLPGGVTGVIEHTTRALHQYSAAVDSIEIVSGSRENIEHLSLDVPVTVLPEIGYMSKQRLAEYAPVPSNHPDGSQGGGPVGQVHEAEVAAGADVLTKRISRELYSQWGGNGVWWVHNYHLGKNPAFTRALLEIARTHPDQQIVLHIHDFPECGRYSNLRYLRQAGVTDSYPNLPNLTYLTINSRDRDYLLRAGVSNVHYLANPVPTSTAGANQPAHRDVRTRLAQHFDREFARFHHDDLLLLYPVRTIRRKNIFEAALITMGLSQPASLVVTLPGVSQAEKQYSQMVQHAFQDGTIPGLWGIGTRLDEAGLTFRDVQHSADAIVSTSVQEGFGYQFIDPLLHATPLIARRLPVVQDVEDFYREWPHALYQQILVPTHSPSLSGPQALLRFRYTERIDRLAPHIPAEIVAQLHQEVTRMVEAEAIDFSFLLPHMQFTYLKDMREHPTFRREVVSRNHDLFQQIEAALNHRPTGPHPGVEQRFGLASFAGHVDSILTTATAPVKHSDQRPSGENAASEHMVAAFAHLDYQRLLYE